MVHGSTNQYNINMNSLIENIQKVIENANKRKAECNFSDEMD